jgi:Ni/Co efflux regulator RcnB
LQQQGEQQRLQQGEQQRLQQQQEERRQTYQPGPARPGYQPPVRTFGQPTQGQGTSRGPTPGPRPERTFGGPSQVTPSGNRPERTFGGSSQSGQHGGAVNPPQRTFGGPSQPGPRGGAPTGNRPQRTFGGSGGGQRAGAGPTRSTGIPRRNPSGQVYTYHGHAYAPFRVARYHWPSGHAYHRYGRGARLPRLFWIARYLIEDYLDYGLTAPADGFEWVRYGPDLLLIDLSTGEVQDAVYGAFEESPDVQDAPDDGSDQGGDDSQAQAPDQPDDSQPPADYQSGDQSNDQAPPPDQPQSSGPLGDAAAGLDALNRGDDAAAIQLLTRALKSGGLSTADRELAYLKRGEAYLAAGDRPKALADADRALGLESGDSEASDLRDQARSSGDQDQATRANEAAQSNDVGADATLNQQITAHNQAIEAQNQAAQAAFEAQKQAYQEQLDANAANYAAQLAAHQAELEALERKRAADLAAWQACKNGDNSQCGAN